MWANSRLMASDSLHQTVEYTLKTKKKKKKPCRYIVSKLCIPINVRHFLQG